MTSFGRVCANISEEEGEQTSWIGCEKLVWVRVGSLGVVGFVLDHWFACSIMEKMENMWGGVTGKAMHVISKPALPVPNSFKGMQGRSWASGLVSLLKKT